MTEEFRESRLRAMADLYAKATPFQIWTWRHISPGMFLAEQVTQWPFNCSAEERQLLAKAFSLKAAFGEIRNGP
ncbi:hypothetical protein ACVME8_005341 [Bradyrhizobium diazoefficiens]